MHTYKPSLGSLTFRSSSLLFVAKGGLRVLSSQVGNVKHILDHDPHPIDRFHFDPNFLECALLNAKLSGNRHFQRSTVQALLPDIQSFPLSRCLIPRKEHLYKYSAKRLVTPTAHPGRIHHTLNASTVTSLLVRTPFNGHIPGRATL
ncbi:hypothetical protein CORC01_01675 [Colletotrichum orchidophilum]|uniref:Uncharacterized protein n=1 Tax=Colletotrichum orchidophilum TaxID=1209926 RepID=A0A1G4BNL9_9PEZI|nr:uncharacterized protein CORC01_01675 [Colletotrichum orchidophilum]OHF02917.1 hypothetical protein CORC01_01675 [Colletotrichum orchidophilum]